MTRTLSLFSANCDPKIAQMSFHDQKVLYMMPDI